MKQIRQVLTQKIYQANRQMGYYHGDSHDWSDRMESDGQGRHEVDVIPYVSYLLHAVQQKGSQTKVTGSLQG